LKNADLASRFPPDINATVLAPLEVFIPIVTGSPGRGFSGMIA
jgi:hypothetical protein